MAVFFGNSRPNGFAFDPERFEGIEDLPTFREATALAAEYAKKYKCVTAIRRSDTNLWEVLIDSGSFKTTPNSAPTVYSADEEAADRHKADDAYRENAWQEEVDRFNEDIKDELKDDSESLAQSEEEGWYYDDDD